MDVDILKMKINSTCARNNYFSQIKGKTNRQFWLYNICI